MSCIQTKNLGRASLSKLSDHFGSLEEIQLNTAEEISEIIGKRIDSINIIESEKAINMAKKMLDIGIRLLIRKSEEFPKKLRNINSCPEYLCIKGEILPKDDLALAIVGTRAKSEYGWQTTRWFAEGVARAGVTIVSGLAAGIDTLAHKAALNVGARTIAVLGNGIDIIYPPENKKLYEQIPKNGAIISEHLLGAEPEKHNFPARNRIVSGLAKGVLVTSAPKKSGSLITANYASEQGKLVFTVPGSIFEQNTAGNNKLLKNGAIPVTDVKDILVEFGLDDVQINSDDKNREILKELNDDQRKIFNILSAKRMPVDVISKMTGLRTQQVLSDLFLMEMKGYVIQRPGKNFIRCN